MAATCRQSERPCVERAGSPCLGVVWEVQTRKIFRPERSGRKNFAIVSGRLSLSFVSRTRQGGGRTLSHLNALTKPIGSIALLYLASATDMEDTVSRPEPLWPRFVGGFMAGSY